MLKIAIALLVTLSAAPALAAATPWQEIAPGVKARLISSDAVTDGTTLAGLELRLPPGTRTYWRIPGETGLPTQFDFAGSTNIGSPEVIWPYPGIERQQGFLDYVYTGDVVLPVRFEVSGNGPPAVLATTVTLGICSDLCLPAQARFSLPLNLSKPDGPEGLRLDQAMAVTPIPWDRPGQPFGSVSLSPDGGSLLIVGLDPAIDPRSIIADLNDPSILFGAPQKGPDAAAWSLKLLGNSGAGLEGRSVRLTFLTAMGPYAVSRTIGKTP